MKTEVNYAQLQYEDDYRRFKEAYDNGDPLISDEEFDRFETLGKEKFPDSEVFNIVGMEADAKIKHNIPMMSLDKTRDVDELIKWASNKECAQTEFNTYKELLATQKLDGCSCSMHYKFGRFSHGVTRGNGVFGQDITRALQYVNFPKNIKVVGNNSNLEIRGELVIKNKDFVLLNQELKNRGLNEAKSRRNIIPGLISSIRKSDLDLAKYITFKAYDVLDTYFATEFSKMDTLSETYGFDTPEYTLVRNIDELKWEIAYFTENKNVFDVLCDGLVFTMNDTLYHTRTDKNPKYKIAFKLENEIVSTKILDIIVDVSGNGRLSFVAIVEPAEINEATISRVTLHNMDYIREHHINIGATIGIVRSGDVIPKHQITLIENGEYLPPKFCPKCGELLHMDGAFLTCENLNCSSRALGKLNKWIEIIDAKGISDKTVESLWIAGLIKTPSDFYKLNLTQIANLDGFGVRSAELIVDTIIEKKNTITSESIIRGCNITNIGKSVSSALIEKYQTIETLCEYMTYDDLETIPNIGEETATLLLKSRDIIMNFYNEMKTVVKINQKEKPLAKSNKLDGKSFCLTGTLSAKRDEVESLIKENGGTIKSVSKNLNYLLVGMEPGSKLEKAKSAGVEIISENDLYKMIR